MCGIAGFLFSSNFRAPPDKVGRAMADAIRHRGPDDEGLWIDEEAGVVLAHRRLSILDLSPAGHQPMVSASGRHVIVFNGEIYNFAEVRAALEKDGRAPAWCGHTDTEILLEAIAAWGIARALGMCVGMFAFAIWDRQERTLTLARDRLGEKPLYYGWSGGTFLFGSELAALRQHPDWQGEIDRQSLALMMRFNNVPAPRSIYKGISKLRPGTFLHIGPDRREAEPQTYWSATKVAADGLRSPFTGSPGEAVRETERLLQRAVREQMVADVPLGAFLSGGVDSSTIVALMQEASARSVKTFTIGFAEEGFDEAQHAKAVARHLGTEHTELYVSPAEARAVIPELPNIYSEPFADSSQIPTYLVARLARQHVTVSLSGDAGDEVFCGYRRYAYAANTWPKLTRVPRLARIAAAKAVTAIKPRHWDAIAGRSPHAGERLHKAARVMALDDLDRVYLTLVSHWDDPSSLVLDAVETEPRLATLTSDPVRRMMLHDTLGYLPDDILVKVDRAAMAVSLETRVPLLDHRLITFAFTLPVSILRHCGQSKWPLREILYSRVPRDLVERPKSGFAVPLAAWLTGPLRPWAEDLLDEARLGREGFFRAKPVRQAWRDLLDGRTANQERIWNVLMFQAWHQSLTAGTTHGGSRTAHLAS
jgi:asparagine synthase (glutamine-hydrolysing)